MTELRIALLGSGYMGRSAATVPGEEGRAAVAIVEAARESARSGQAVEMIE